MKYGPRSPLITQNKSQYQNYEEDLDQYLSNGKVSELQQWTMMESKLLKNTPKPKYTPNHPHKQIPNQTIKNSSRQSDLSQSIVQENSNYLNQKYNRFSKQKDTYCYLIANQINNKNLQSANMNNLRQQIKLMRDLLIQLNNETSQRLNKYQIAHFQPKNMMPTNQPQKQEELLEAQIQSNNWILDSQHRQIQSIRKRDKQLEERDFLIQLQEKANDVIKQIHEKNKEKHHQKVVVHKLDSKLIEMKQKNVALEMEEEYRMAKILQHQILYYFKKTNENQEINDELDQQYQELLEKDRKITEKYKQLCQRANQNNMIVSSNREYLHLKKIQDELKVKAEKIIKNIDIIKFSTQINIEKVNKDIFHIRKQIEKVEIGIIETNEASDNYANKADQLIQQNQIGENMVKNLPYKFAETLLKDSLRKLNKQLQLQQQQKQQQIFIKPRIKITRHKKDKPFNLDRSQQVSSRFRTLEQPTQRYQTPRKINDKNMSSIGTSLDKIPMKPNLRIKKTKKTENNIELEINKNMEINKNSYRLNRLKANQSKLSKQGGDNGPISEDL